MDLNLRAKTALITGGSRGIGLAAARALREEGCTVRLVARTQESLDQAKKLLGSAGQEVQAQACDLGQPNACERLQEISENIDILVNNAGAIPRGALIDVDSPSWRAAWDLKVFGYIDLSRMVYARMKMRQSGVIINIIGVGGERPSATYIAGSSANAALMAFTCALGGESVDFGVRVVGINPGMVATDRMVTLLKKDAERQLGDSTRWRELLRSRPFGRAAEPEEIASVVAFLASEKASYISGTVVTIDGGATTRQPPL